MSVRTEGVITQSSMEQAHLDSVIAQSTIY